jgi:hypothetical protein
MALTMGSRGTKGEMPAIITRARATVERRRGKALSLRNLEMGRDTSKKEKAIQSQIKAGV